MLIEFVGCTGAGKTTIASRVTQALRDSGLVVDSRISTSSSLLVSARNVADGIAGAVLIPLLSRRHHRYASSVVKMIRECHLDQFWTTARAVATYRLVGRHAVTARAQHSNSIALIDEGILTTISLAFSCPRRLEVGPLAQVLAKLALPDVIVHVNAPLTDLVRRTVARTDKPREIASMRSDDVRCFLSHCSTAYQSIFSSSDFAQKVVPVWNPSAGSGEMNQRIDDLAHLLHARIQSWHRSQQLR